MISTPLLPSLPSFGLLALLRFFGLRVVWIPPRVRRPINRRAIAIRRPAFEPQSTFFVLPNAGGMAVEFLAAMQAPVFLIQVGPLAANTMLSQEIEFLIIWQSNIFHWIKRFDGTVGCIR